MNKTNIFKVRCLYDNGPFRKGEIYEAIYVEDSPKKPFRVWFDQRCKDDSTSLMFSSEIFGNSRVRAIFLIERDSPIQQKKNAYKPCMDLI